MARPPRIPNWLPWEQRSVYFITFCTERRRPVLAKPSAWEICLRIFSRLDEWTTLAAIAMPDHRHALVAPLDRDASVAAFSKWFKRWFDEEYCRANCRASVPDAILGNGVSQKRPTTDAAWNGRKAVSTVCFGLMNRSRTSGNT